MRVLVGVLGPTPVSFYFFFFLILLMFPLLVLLPFLIPFIPAMLARKFAGSFGSCSNLLFTGKLPGEVAVGIVRTYRHYAWGEAGDTDRGCADLDRRSDEIPALSFAALWLVNVSSSRAFRVVERCKGLSQGLVLSCLRKCSWLRFQEDDLCSDPSVHRPIGSGPFSQFPAKTCKTQVLLYPEGLLSHRRVVNIPELLPLLLRHASCNAELWVESIIRVAIGCLPLRSVCAN